jgi:dephospho-CoA kinase
MTSHPKKLICLTGGIATGKSRVGAWFAEHGWDVICTDEIVHQLYEPGKSLPKLIAAEFGKGTVNAEGRVDRKALSEIVFKDSAALQKLNAMVHPVVREEWKRRVEVSQSQGKRVMVMIPLAYETGVTKEFQQTWVVACNIEKQRERLQERGISLNEAERRIASQMPLQKKIDLADIVIWNNDSWDNTERQIDLINEECCD